MQATVGACISIVVSFFVVLDCVSFALSFTVWTTDDVSFGETFFALICSAVTIFVSFFVLLFITLPACICSSKNQEDSQNCCTPTYFVSVIIAGSSSIIGTFVTGATQIYTLYLYEDISSNSKLSSQLRATAALNFTAAFFGTLMIFTTLCTCLSKNENWLFCKERPSCMIGSIKAFPFIAALVITSLIASLLTMLMFCYISSYSSEHVDSPNDDRVLYATLFSFTAACCVLVGFCIGGPFLCWTSRDLVRATGCVMCIWALLATGTIIGGGLMMKVGHSFASEETLNPDKLLNRVPLSVMGYFSGALNFVATLIAILLCCSGIFFCNRQATFERIQ